MNMKHIPTFESFLYEGNLSKNFKKGDKIKVNDREGFKELVGKIGTVVGTKEPKGLVYVDFGEKLTGGGFSSHKCDGLLKDETGLSFQDRGWISSKIDPRFDVRNIEKI